MRPPERPTPLPLPSPQVPRDDPNAAHDPLTITGVMRVVNVQQKRWGGLLALIGIVAGGLLAIGGIARAQTDAGVENVKTAQANTDQRLDNHLREDTDWKIRMEAKIDRTVEQGERQRQEMRLILDALKVPESKRPPGPDGGPP